MTFQGRGCYLKKFSIGSAATKGTEDPVQRRASSRGGLLGTLCAPDTYITYSHTTTSAIWPQGSRPHEIAGQIGWLLYLQWTESKGYTRGGLNERRNAVSLTIAKTEGCADITAILAACSRAVPKLSAMWSICGQWDIRTLRQVS